MAGFLVGNISFLISILWCNVLLYRLLHGLRCFLYNKVTKLKANHNKTVLS